MAKNKKRHSGGEQKGGVKKEKKAAKTAPSPVKADLYGSLESLPSAFATLSQDAKRRAAANLFVKVDAVPVGERRSDHRIGKRLCDGSRADRVALHPHDNHDADMPQALSSIENNMKSEKKNKKKKNGKESVKANGGIASDTETGTVALFADTPSSGNVMQRLIEKNKKLANLQFGSVMSDSRGKKRGREEEEATPGRRRKRQETADGEEQMETLVKRVKKPRLARTSDFRGTDFAAVEKEIPYNEDEDEDFEEEDEVESDEEDSEDEVLTDEMSAEDAESGEEDEDEEDEEEEVDDEGETGIQALRNGIVVEGLDSDEDEEEDEEEEGESSDSDSSHISEDSYAIADLEPARKAEVVSRRTMAHSVPIDFLSFPFNSEDSANSANAAFQWMLAPIENQPFFCEYFQEKVLMIRRGDKNYYGNLFSTSEMMRVVRENYVEYGVNLNLAEYKEGLRYTPNGKGRALPLTVMDAVRRGCSVQLTNPQAFCRNIWYLCDALQELYHCFVGANTYLTPAKSAGFAPHWDEIDAFILQVEGRKYWKVYPPKDASEELPLESSGNFTDADMADHVPCFSGWVEQGDLLYIPRGFIHQASTCPTAASLHVTVSVGRQWTFSNLLTRLLPSALEGLTRERVKLRRQLPPGLLDMASVADLALPHDEEAPEILDQPLDRHVSVLRRYVARLTDSGVDEMAREFMRCALPPVLSPFEERLSVWGEEDNKGAARITFTTEIRLIRRHGQRLFHETEEKCFVVHRMTNGRSYEERPEALFDLDLKKADAFSALQKEYPEWVEVGSLPLHKKTDRVSFARLLFDNGLILARSSPVEGFPSP